MMRAARRAAYALLTALTVTLAACNGSGSSAIPQGQPADSDLPPAVGPSVMAQPLAMLPNGLSPVTISPGAINGQDDRFNPADGDTNAGGQGQTIDGIPCKPTMSTSYHVHAYLGIIYRGHLVATPDAIGMYQPGPEQNGYVNSATCFYYIHTHDASGLIHLESPSSAPIDTVLFHLKDVLDIWGIKHSSTRFGPFQSGHKIRTFMGNVPLKTTTVSSYKEMTESYDRFRLRSHTVVWLEIGEPSYDASQLPSVTFYTEY